MDESAVASMDPIPKKEKYLIAFNKFKKITFFGTCKIQINTVDKCLIFRTNSDEKKYQEFESTFNRIFVQKENALCIIDGRSNNNFLVVFNSKATCDQIIAGINKAKFPNGNPLNDPAMDDELFKNNFYIPILKEIQLKITGFMEIKTIILDLVNNFETGQRQIYMNMVFEELIFSTSNNDSSMVNESSTVAAKDIEPKVGVEIEGTIDNIVNSSVDQSLNETTTTSSNYSFRKRPAINYSLLQNLSNDESNLTSSATKKARLSPSNGINQTTNANHSFSNDIVTASYKVIEYFRRNAVRKLILIFTSDDKKECYEFYYKSINSNSVNTYNQCKGCIQMKQKTLINIISSENGKMQFKFGKMQHICQPIKYSPDNYNTEDLPLQISKLPSEQEKERKSLTNAINNVENIIRSPDFQLIQRPRAFKFSSKLIIFHPKDRSLCYEYSVYQSSINKYRCRECVTNFNHYVGAKLVKNEGADDFVELGAAEHLCKPKKFNDENADNSKLRIIQKPNFKIEMVPNIHKRGETIKRLIISDPAYCNKTFTYHFIQKLQHFFCRKCQKNHKHVSAKLMEGEDGEECIQLSGVEHVCQ